MKEDRCPCALYPKADAMPAWKRAVDIGASSLGIALLSPLLLLIAAVIKVSSSGPALLKQQRVGRQGKIFTMWKFRTMWADAGESAHQEHLKTLIEMDTPMTKLDAGHDPRVFPAGRIIRRCYLDELPQLINVLNGDMSLVGPRPCLPYEATQLKPWQRERFRVLPGMTGLWQVSGKNSTTFTEMMQLDIAYADRLSLLLDLKILIMTITVVFSEAINRLVHRQSDRNMTAGVLRKNT
jgi:exopolysaccharide production protein ExoY